MFDAVSSRRLTPTPLTRAIYKSQVRLIYTNRQNNNNNKRDKDACFNATASTALRTKREMHQEIPKESFYNISVMQ